MIRAGQMGCHAPVSSPAPNIETINGSAYAPRTRSLTYASRLTSVVPGLARSRFRAEARALYQDQTSPQQRSRRKPAPLGTVVRRWLRDTGGWQGQPAGVPPELAVRLPRRRPPPRGETE